MTEREIFVAALEIDNSYSRDAYLHSACGGHSVQRGRIDSLLNAHNRAGDFLGSPAASQDLLGTLTLEVGPMAGQTIGPYLLREQIGEGGMGLVFVADQEQPVRRRVALKVVKPGMDTRQVLARFEVERHALALMDHPNIARVLDGGTTDSSGHTPCAVAADGTRSVPATLGRPYFVMELVRGVPITDYCDQAQLSTRERLELFLPVCRAIQHAHQKGVIHRDIKPSNLLVTQYDARPVPKVIDFGIAKAVGPGFGDQSIYTGFAQLVGTPMYISPEQAEMTAQDVDTRADVYSLGVVLYELLTGTTPFDGEKLRQAGFDEMRRIIREDEPDKPSQRVTTMSAEKQSTVSGHRGVDGRQLWGQLRCGLDWVVMTCLEKDRTRRYESAGALAADIERYLRDEPVLACPPSASYRLRTFARRNRVALATFGLVTAALLIGMFVSISQAVEATEARQLADVRLQNEKQARVKEEQQRRRAQDNFGAVLDGMTEFLEELGTNELLDDHQKVALRQALADHMELFFQRLSIVARTDPLTRHQTGWAYLHLAVFYLRLSDYDRAEEKCRKALEIHEAQAGEYPDDLEILWMHAKSLEALGTIVFLKGKTAEGRILFNQAFEQQRHRLEVDPSGRAHSELASSLVTCVDAGLHDPAEAVQLATRGVNLRPDDPSRWYILGQAHFSNGNWQEARHDVEKHSSLQGHEDGWDFLLLAMIYWRLDEKDRAHDYYNRAVQWMSKKNPHRNSFMLRQLRAEAAALLGKKDKER